MSKTLPEVLEGQMNAQGLKVAVVISRFNEFIGDKLLDAAIDTLTRSGASIEDIQVAKVPGAFEIPLAAAKLAETKKYDAIVCLGAIIRGGTPHFEYVAGEATKGIARVSAENGIPVSFGVITADTLEQAIERAGAKSGNKGREATLAAIEMASLLKSIK